MNRVILTDAGSIGGIPYVRLGNTGNFSVFKTFDCGQCFRWKPNENGKNAWYGSKHPMA